VWPFADRYLWIAGQCTKCLPLNRIDHT
jgi:hypothetical protein